MISEVLSLLGKVWIGIYVHCEFTVVFLLKTIKNLQQKLLVSDFPVNIQKCVVSKMVTFLFSVKLQQVCLLMHNGKFCCVTKNLLCNTEVSVMPNDRTTYCKMNNCF